MSEVTGDTHGGQPGALIGIHLDYCTYNNRLYLRFQEHMRAGYGAL